MKLEKGYWVINRCQGQSIRFIMKIIDRKASKELWNLKSGAKILFSPNKETLNPSENIDFATLEVEVEVEVEEVIDYLNIQELAHKYKK